MKHHLPVTSAALALMLGLCTQAFAQAQRDQTFTHGESKRCESLSGDEKVLCDKEEATKAQGAAAEEASKPPSTDERDAARPAEEPASAGSTAPEKADPRSADD